MNIEDRIKALTGPIVDCGAAIDAARVMAAITGTFQVLYLDNSMGGHVWHVRAMGEEAPESWVRTGGVYSPNDTRSVIQTDRALTPELADERGIYPAYRASMNLLRDQYRTFLRLANVPSWPIPACGF